MKWGTEEFEGKSGKKNVGHSPESWGEWGEGGVVPAIFATFLSHFSSVQRMKRREDACKDVGAFFRDFFWELWRLESRGDYVELIFSLFFSYFP